MKAPVKTKYFAEENIHLAIIKVPHSNYQFEIETERYGNKNDISTLHVKVYQKIGKQESIYEFDYIKHRTRGSDLFSLFLLPVNNNYTPPFAIEISSADSDINLSEFGFSVSVKDLIAK